LAKGGEDTLENLAAAHRKCNRAKGDGGPAVKAAVAFVTDRCW
jgi:5-methylcytosine-specific restriction endonuclease McrA